MNNPEISIIMATYNRSNILCYSIGSVISQKYELWELIVVGDCCTDDSESVVASFKDARIRFVNLTSNTGEQSGPNNEGVKMASGSYIAFLNHDDLWFDDHLQCCLDTLRNNNADLVFAGGIVDHGNQTDFDITGLLSSQRGYHPGLTFVPASNWLFKRELVQEIGPWRPAKDLYLVPSHNWQERAHQAGKKIVPTGQITVAALPSSSRKYAYSQRDFSEHHYYFQNLNNPDFRNKLLTGIIYNWGQTIYYDESIYLIRFFRRKVKGFLNRLGINSIELSHFFKFGKGGIIREYRQRRGLHNQY